MAVVFRNKKGNYVSLELQASFTPLAMEEVKKGNLRNCLRSVINGDNGDWHHVTSIEEHDMVEITKSDLMKIKTL